MMGTYYIDVNLKSERDCIEVSTIWSYWNPFLIYDTPIVHIIISFFMQSFQYEIQSMITVWEISDVDTVCLTRLP
jgi:hypothetical protein